MARIKTQGKVIIGAAIVALGMTGAYFGGLLDTNHQGVASSVPTTVALPAAQDQTAAQSTVHRAVTIPTTNVVTAGAPVRFLGYAWNSQMGLMFSNGGPVTTQGSLMAERGIKLTIGRQDDNSLLQSAIQSCARELSEGKADCTSGAHFVAIMGDGASSFLLGLNQALSELPGEGMVAEIVASAGYSRGEDKFMGPPAWRDHPEQAKGGLVAGVIRDGDWNIAMYWAANNQLCNNPDTTTYDPNCLNWVGTSSYLEPVEKYNQNACETRPVVRNGVRTGETRRVCVQGVVTWTPGDVNVVRGRGGLVSILSTKENAAQMPNAFIGIRRWNQTHRETLVKLVEAMGLGGQAVSTDSRALTAAARISDAVYNEEDTGPLYWETYFHGRDETDPVTNEVVHLGGSKANNLADMQALFGLLPGTTNSFSATYTAFGNIMHQQYPHDMPTVPAFDTVSDTSYIQAAAQRSAQGEVAETQHFDPNATTRVVGRRNWTINFQTGSAEFTPDTIATLNSLRDQLLVASGAFVDIHGHTDNVGDPSLNMALSERRAEAVATWLRNQSEVSFSSDRVHTYGHGSDNPVNPSANNNSPVARAANRRVTIELRAN